MHELRNRSNKIDSPMLDCVKLRVMWMIRSFLLGLKMSDVEEFIDLIQGMKLLKNLVSSKVKTFMQDYNDVLYRLLQEFRDKAAGDILVVMHRI